PLSSATDFPFGSGKVMKFPFESTNNCARPPPLSNPPMMSPRGANLNGLVSSAFGTLTIVISPSCKKKPWKSPVPGAVHTASVQKRPLMSPRSSIPSGFVNVEPGGSKDVKTPSFKRKPCRTLGEAGSEYHPAMSPLLLIEPATEKDEPGKSID